MEGFTTIPTKTWYLEYPADKEISPTNNNISVEKWRMPEVDEYLGLYKKIGAQYGWSQRLTMEKNQLMQFLTKNNGVDVFLFNVKGKNAGYFEIDFSKNKEAEIVYLGLSPEFIGKGFGKSIIHEAIRKASKEGKNRVWLHTCEHDHPSALSTYQKAGFVIYKEEVLEELYPNTHRAVRNKW